MSGQIMFAFATISAVAAVLGASWIIAQAMLKTASNPVYDTKFAYGEKTMDELRENVDQLKLEVREVRHGQNNLKMGFQGLNTNIETILRELRGKADS
jgi:hypothetical protein